MNTTSDTRKVEPMRTDTSLALILALLRDVALIVFVIVYVVHTI
jgi:hypothetical protein